MDKRGQEKKTALSVLEANAGAGKSTFGQERQAK